MTEWVVTHMYKRMNVCRTMNDKTTPQYNSITVAASLTASLHNLMTKSGSLIL